ncbi:hypothetical protein BBK14_27700 [Parafrankia soli]|uniref:PucR family transcriptional regulator n=2 Tax=Parafrankia soli TaxID=2599596 RepID=A0A1S1PHQ9_9ACTN|nr:hypothetical protein BBK14_27700 [Parafrankia soli]
MLAAAATGRRPDRDELDASRRLSAHAACAGEPLSDLVDLYMSATRALWPHLPQLVRTSRAAALTPRDPMAMGSAVLRAADDTMGAIAAGFSDAQRRMVQREETQRREFVDDLLGGQAEVGRLVERAEQFGLRLASGHVVAVLQAADPVTDTSRITAWTEASLRTRFPDSDLFVTTKDGRLLTIVAVGPPGTAAANGAVARVGESVTVVARRAYAASHRAPAWQVGVGRPHPGPRGVLLSYNEAREALDLAGRLTITTPLVAAGDLLVYRVLLRDQAAMADLVRAVLLPLEQAHTGPEPLLDTLSAYFACGCVAAAAARQQRLSVRAVTYRLSRVRALTGYDLTVPLHRLTVEVAVIGARLLGWPTQPLPPPDQA